MALVLLALLAVGVDMTLRGAGMIGGWIAGPLGLNKQPTYTVPGTIRLTPGQYVTEGQSCHGTALSPDTQVVVTDPSGAALTYAPVGAGTERGGGCEMPFTIVVPAGKGTYSVDVPQYGLKPYTEQEIADLRELTIS